MVDRSVGRTTHITAQMKCIVPLLIAVLTLIAGCWPWPNGEYEFRFGDTVKVVDTGTDGLRVRSTPAGTVTALVPNNWVFQISNVIPESATLNGGTYLWWYVTDAQYESSPTSGWVAEEYLTKVASNSLTPSTVPAYFTASTGQIDSVVEQAFQEIKDGSEWYDHDKHAYLCLKFVREVYKGQLMGWPSAHAAMVALQNQGLFHYAASNWNPPKGALVFFDSTSVYDHVGLCVGSRQVVHVEGDRKAHVRDLRYIVRQLDYIKAYAGWAYPPEEWCQGVPQEARIAYFSNQTGNADIWVMLDDGSINTRITSNSADDWDPDWSADGTIIAFETWRDGNAEIYLMSASGANQRNVTNHPAEDAHPDWSSDGLRIVFSSDRHQIGSAHDIYVMNADGSNVINLTNDAGYDWYPAWSPDGSKIAFSSNRDGQFEVYVMDADGRSLTKLTQGGGECNQPAWSPNGDRIAYFQTGAGSRDIYVMDADSGNKRRVTTGSWEDNRDPSWAPGRTILFSSNQDGDFDIYSIDPDGTDEIQLTFNSHDDFHPAWEPEH